VSDLSDLVGRGGWLPDAHARFAAELPAVLAAQLTRPDGTARVLLAGLTQVGKTTLALSLLGVRDGDRGHVEAVLRGGRAAGKSATQRPMRYVWSSSEDWSVWLGRGSVERLMEVELLEVLAVERAALEAGRAATDVLEIGLPSRYRDPAVVLDTVITDLPGMEAASPGETRAAKTLLERHASVADVVLVCIKADQLTPLLPTHPLGEAVRPVLAVPERVRFVLTSAAQPQEIRRHLANATLDELLDHYREQLRTFRELPDDDAVLRCAAQHLYLLDVGASRSRPGDNAELLTTVDSSLDRLRSSITPSALEGARYLTADSVQRLVAQHHRDESRLSEQRVRAAEGRLARRREELGQAEAAVEAARASASAADRRFARLKKVGRPVLPDLQATRPADDPTGDKARAAVDQTRERYLQACRKAWTDWSATLPPDLTGPRWTSLAVAFEALYDDAVPCCSECGGWGFWRRRPVDPCIERARTGTKDAVRSGRNDLAQRAQRVMSPALARAHREVDKAAGSVAVLERDLLQRRDGVLRDEASLLVLRQTHAEDLEEAGAASTRVDRFQDHLRAAVADRRGRQLDALRRSSSPLDRLTLALAAVRDHDDLRSRST